MTSDKEELIAYLDRYWSEDAKTFLTVKLDEDTYKVLPVSSWALKKEAVADRILVLVAQGSQVYFAPANYNPDSPTKEKVHVRGSKFLWVDFDGNAVEALKNYPADLPKPTIRNQTGPVGYEHWYWELDREYSVEEFELINQRLTYFLDADKGCWDASRVLRPIHTKNFKPKYLKPPFNLPDFPEVFTVEDTKQVSNIEVFDKVLPGIRALQSEEISSLKELGKLPPVAEVLAKYHWDDEHADLFIHRSGKDLIDNNGKSNRDEAMFRLAMYGAEIGMPDAAIYVVVDAFAKRTGKFDGRKDREKQLLKFVEKARAKHPSSAVDNVYGDNALKVVYTFTELLDSEFELDWLIEDFIPRGTINFISAQSGIGKSRLSMQLAYACATGGKFLEWDITEPLKSMYVSLEMDGPMLKHFSKGLAKGKEVVPAWDNLLLVPVGESISLEDSDFFERLIKEHAPDVMFIDALGSLTLEAIDEENAKAINNKLKSLNKKYGITFVIIHHNRKDGQATKSEPDLNSVYGSQYVITDAAVVMTMHRINADKTKLIMAKTRAVERPIDYVVMDSSSSFEFIVSDNEDENDDTFANKNLKDVGSGNFFESFTAKQEATV